MIRLALVVLLAACNGIRDTDDLPTEDIDGDGYTEDEGDCNDDNDAINPGETEEWYDGVDQDCSGGSDQDQDGDGVDIGTTSNRDCDDEDPSVYPGAVEVYYDGVDANCDDKSDYDADGDDYDASTHGGTDCDDTKADVNPGELELCSTAYDDDCEGGINENDADDTQTWYPDDDEDTFGSPENAVTGCTQPEGFVLDNTDCNDDPEPGVGDVLYPGAPAVACDGYDNDCDPLTFEAAVVKINGVAAGSSLEAAVIAAAPGDVVSLCEGKHLVNDVTIVKELTIQGIGQDVTIVEAEQIQIDSNPHPTNVTLVAHGAPLLRVDTTYPVVIEDLTLTKGGGYESGGTADDGCGEVPDDDWHGGGLCVTDAGDVTLSDVRIVGNRSGFGSGVYAGKGATLNLLRVTIADNIGDDDAVFVYPIGGGMFLDADTTLNLHDSTIDGNEANIGGGIATGMGVTIAATGRSIVSGNDGGLTGGGVDLEDGGVITGLTIAGNTAVSGAGVHASETTVRPEHISLTDVTLSENYANNQGGGLTALGVVSLSRTLVIDNAGTFSGNIYAVGDDTTVSITDGAVRGGRLITPSGGFSTLGRGGGAYVADATLQSTNVDWGVGDTDNIREDVWLEMALPDTNGIAGKQGFFGADATFLLDDEVGGCYPDIGETCP